MTEVPGSEQILKADLVFLAMGFVSARADRAGRVWGGGRPAWQRQGFHRFGRRLRHNAPKLFAAGDTAAASPWWSGPSASCQAARAVDEFLMGATTLATLIAARSFTVANGGLLGAFGAHF